MPSEPYTFDLYNIFFGDKSPWFFLEVAGRTIFIFAYTLTLLRWMGKRGMGNLTPFEFGIIIALGSAVGDSMFYDDVPLMHTMLVIGIVIGMQRLLAWATERNTTLERIIESTPRLLVRGGVMHMGNLHREKMSREELCEELRSDGVRHLGEVEVAYLEPSGKLSVIRYEKSHPGLLILPQRTNDGEHDHKLPKGPGGDNSQCCACCGAGRGTASQCENCGESQWSTAVSP